ncbi:MAG: helix-turn-helix domain-containing protein [Blastocatellia bacterium]
MIQTNLHRPLSLEFLARRVNLSGSRLRNLFVKVVGVPLSEYAKLLRMEKARQLLVTEFLTIKEVMARIGIKDLSHFNRDFKLIYGVTPAQYRNRNS